MKEDDLADFLYFDDIPQKIKRELKEIDYDSSHWIELFENKKTKQLWAIDTWDKYVHQVAFKIVDKESWKMQDFTEMRKELLLKSRGGLADKKCMWKDCNNRRVKGVLFCIDHLYDSGARK